MVIYLCGGINGLTDEQAKGCRRYCIAALEPKHTCLDPMKRDYRGNEAGNEEAIINADLMEVDRADALIVMAETPSWGTAMGVFLCGTSTRETLLCSLFQEEPFSVARWYATKIFPRIEDCVAWIVGQS